MNPVGIVGNYNIDIVIGNVKETPRWDIEMMAERFEKRVAGTAGYMALALHGLGIPSVIISSLGQDDLGEFVIKELENRGLETEGIIPLPDVQTPTGFVVVHENGSRVIISISGAHDFFDLSMYREKKHLLEKCEEIVICGNYLLPKFSVREAVEVAKEQKLLGKKIYFDPSWDPNGWNQETRELTLELLKYVNVFLPNETEICHLTGKMEWQDALTQVSQYCDEVVVKLGKKGAAVMKNGQLKQVTGENVDVVDTTGAGDAFDMGYLFASRHETSLEKRLRFANKLAAKVISQKDRDSYPSLEEITAEK